VRARRRSSRWTGARQLGRGQRDDNEQNASGTDHPHTSKTGFLPPPLRGRVGVGGSYG